MTPINKKLHEFYFLIYPMTEDLPFYINDFVELMAFTGLRKFDLVYKINQSKSNHILCNVEGKQYNIYYFL